MSLQPSAAYWAVAILGSLLLHAGAVGAAALLLDFHEQKSSVTEIIFSAPPPPAVAPAASPAEKITALKQLAAPAARAAKVEPHALQPATPTVAALSHPVETALATTARATSATAKAVPSETAPAAAQSRLVTETANPAATEKASAAETAEEAAPLQANAARIETTAVRAKPVQLPADGAQPQASARVEPQPSVRAQPAKQIGAVEIAASSAAVPSPSPQPATSAAQAPMAPTASAAGRAAVVTASRSAPLERASAPRTASAAAPAQQLQTGTEVASSGAAAQRLRPIATVTSGAASGSAEAPSARTTVAPTAGSTEVALLVPARPGSNLGTETDRPSDRYRQVIDFIRNFDGGSCFVALPAISSSGAVEFQTFGKDKAHETEFTNAYAGALGMEADVSLGNVADPQCLALSFARKVERYPAFSLIIELDRVEMTSGSVLSGSVLNAKDRPVNLLLIDDEGRVQAIDRFLSAADGPDRRFRAPLTLTGGPVATKQLLMAIVTDRPVKVLDGTTNELATDFFSRLAREIIQSGADVDIALEGFSVL